MTNLSRGAIIAALYLIIFMNYVFHHTQYRIICDTAYNSFMRLLRKMRLLYVRILQIQPSTFSSVYNFVVVCILTRQPSCQIPMLVMHYITFQWVNWYPSTIDQLTTWYICNINIFTFYLGIMCFIENDSSHKIICVMFYIFAYNESFTVW
jgi:hypothetical protein